MLEIVERACAVRPMEPSCAHLLPLLPQKDFLALLATVDATQGCSPGHHVDFVPSVQDLLPPVVEAEEGKGEAAIGLGLPQRDLRAVMSFSGGEDAGRARLQQWMFDGNHLRNYFDVRNGLLGEAYSSKLSPWLANGCISARYVYFESKRYETERNIKNKSTYWITFELLCRDFFHLLCAKYGNSIFHLAGPKRLGRSIPWSRSEEGILRWKQGLTGISMVDANMRELLLTGWMSNRGRQIVASYLVHNLRIDWRVGADHFESLLLDHDVKSNYGMLNK